MKIIIADDEKLICRLIYSLIEWEKLNVEFAGFAHSGVELYELVQKEKPDIIITDINMPELNGLELIRKLRHENINTKVIIVTGYQHFEYAHSAIKYNVDDYLLKPINKSELNNSLKNVISDIKKEKYKEKRSLSSNSDLIVEDIEKYIEENKKEWIENKFFQFLICKIHSASSSKNSEIVSLGKTFERIIGDHLKPHGIDFVFVHSGSLIKILTSSKTMVTDLEETIEIIYEKLNEYTKIFATVNTYFYIGKARNQIKELIMDYYNLKEIISLQLAEEHQYITNLDNIEKKTNEEKINNVFENFKNNVLARDFINIKNSFLGLSSYNPNPYDVYLVFLEFKKLINFIYKDYNLSVEEEREYKKATSRLDEILITSNKYSEFIRLSNDFFVKQINDIAKRQKQKNILPIEKAIDYIHNNYNRDVSLDEIADYVDLTPNYFSSLFKKHTNENFSDFITGYRMKRAKDYLISTNSSIKEIAFLVGYNEPKYFSKVFRKQVGVRPSAYRKMFN